VKGWQIALVYFIVLVLFGLMQWWAHSRIPCIDFWTRYCP